MYCSPVRQKTSKKTSRRHEDSDSSHSRGRSSRRGDHESGKKSLAKKRHHSRSPRPRSPKCQACGATPLPHKRICQDCMRDYAADRESEGMQVADLLKKAIKDSFAELVASMPSQPVVPLQEQPAGEAIPGPSTSGIPRPTPASSSKHQEEDDASGDSSDDQDVSGFAFSMVQPYV